MALRHFLKEQLAACFTSRATPEQSYPKTDIHYHGPCERIATPELPALPLHADCRHLQADSYLCPRPWTAVLRDVLYYPDQNLLLTADGRLLEQADQVPFRFHDLHYRPWLGMEVRPLRGRFTTLRSYRDNHYHTMVDNMPSLMLAPAEVKLALASPLNPVEKFLLQRLLGRLPETVELAGGRLYRLEEYHFASFATRRYAGYLPARTVARLRDEDEPGGGRLFISRASARKGRRIGNESAVMDVLRPHGFERLELETIPMEEQARLFARAECVVAAHGAALANLLFSRRASVLELFPQPTLWPHFYLLSRTGDHPYYFLCHQTRGRDADFCVDIPALRSVVDRMLAELPQR